MKTVKWHVGYQVNNDGVRLVAFKAIGEPAHETHGHLFAASIGPFRTKRAAKWAEQYGYLNPHFQTVNDAERIASSR